MVFMILGAVTAASAQQGGFASLTPVQRAEIEIAQMAGGRGGARAAVETRVTTGAPYSGEAVTEFTQTLADGNRIARKTVTRVFRDSEGRTRREQTTITAAGESVSISIVDPVARTSFVLDPANRVALVSRPVLAAPIDWARGGRGAGGAVTAVPRREPRAPTPQAETEARRREAETAARVDLSETSREAATQLKIAVERTASGGGNSTTENLGQQMMEGVMAEGTRTTTVVPAGAVGNAQPITIVSEQWFSPDLQLLVMTRHSDPRSGESTYRLTNIVRGEPDRSLFEVPADYTIKEPAALKRQAPGEPATIVR
jgi:hypothetical protein